ncbi:MAG: hypothetical protein IJM81_06315 [Prevotella sp.]|nr:hypothetical protein [Prevotella sp.]
MSARKKNGDEVFRHGEIYIRFEDVRRCKKGELPLSDKDWELFEQEFGRCYSDYYASVVCSSRLTTVRQRRVCMLMRLGYRQGEMAIVLNVSKGVVNKIKRQINFHFFGMSESSSLADNLLKSF